MKPQKEKVTIKIPRPLYDNLNEIIKESGFNSKEFIKGVRILLKEEKPILPGITDTHKEGTERYRCSNTVTGSQIKTLYYEGKKIFIVSSGVADADYSYHFFKKDQFTDMPGTFLALIVHHGKGIKICSEHSDFYLDNLDCATVGEGERIYFLNLDDETKMAKKKFADLQ